MLIVYNIASKTPSDHGYHLIEVESLIGGRLVKTENPIREFDEIYEYCLVKDYEDKYKDFKIDIVQFSEVFIKIINLKEEKIILSINFPKDSFDVLQLLDWLKHKEINSFNKEESHVEDASKIYQGIKFKNSIILLYIKGRRDLLIDRSQLIEVDYKIFNYQDQINIFHSSHFDSNKTDMNILLNNKRIDYIPEFDFTYNKANGLVCCNGLIIHANYIGNYDNSIGFFKDKLSKKPICWIFDTDNLVKIDTRYDDDGAEIVFFEYNVGFSIDDFF